MRTIAIAPFPAGVAIAAIVSPSARTLNRCQQPLGIVGAENDVGSSTLAYLHALAECDVPHPTAQREVDTDPHPKRYRNRLRVDDIGERNRAGGPTKSHRPSQLRPPALPINVDVQSRESPVDDGKD